MKVRFSVKNTLALKRASQFSIGCFLLLAVFVMAFRQTDSPKKTVYKPVIEGDWWSITNQPDLGELTNTNQQPVDFGVWQAQDGTWQLWSCIRRTKLGGRGRLFYRWEGKNLTDTAWTPKGIAMQSDTTLGEAKGGLQAPYVFLENGTYYMFYGDWNNICLATSKDGKAFTRVLNDKKTPVLFSSTLYNPRDPMVIKLGSTYYCYYSAHNQVDDKSGRPQSGIFCRTTKNLKDWSEPVVVNRGGTPRKQTPGWGGDSECPFVIKLDDTYVLFRNQIYGKNNLNTQYCSSDPLNFGDDTDEMMVGQMPIAAPEIIKQGNQYYIVSLKPGLDGMKMAKLTFQKEVK